MVENIVLLVVGLVCLFYGGNWLVRGASNLALSFGLSILIIGLTIVAIGTSMPELLVSVQAALAGKSDLAIGNVLGSNIANIGLVLGVTGLITPLGIKAILLRREVPILILFTIFTYILTLDGALSRLDGVILLFSFFGFNTMFYFLAKQEQDARRSQRAEIDSSPSQENSAHLKELAFLCVGVLALVLGSRLMVEGAVNLARQIGVSELVIAITLVAFVTSLPELAASLAAAFHKETDLAIGNIVGSNIANLLLILGVTAYPEANRSGTGGAAGQVHCYDRLYHFADTLHAQAKAGQASIRRFPGRLSCLHYLQLVQRQPGKHVLMIAQPDFVRATPIFRATLSMKAFA